jgi:hypothetical protein
MLKVWPEMRKYLLVWSLCHDSCTILSHTMVSNDKHLQVCAPSIPIYTFKICWSDLWTSCDNNRSSLLEAVCYRLSLIRGEIHRCSWHHWCLSQEEICDIESWWTSEGHFRCIQYSLFLCTFLSDLLRFVGSACEGETTTHHSFHLILCFEECSPSVTLTCEVIFTHNSFFGKFIEHFLF